MNRKLEDALKREIVAQYVEGVNYYIVLLYIISPNKKRKGYAFKATKLEMDEKICDHLSKHLLEYEPKITLFAARKQVA